MGVELVDNSSEVMHGCRWSPCDDLNNSLAGRRLIWCTQWSPTLPTPGVAWMREPRWCRGQFRVSNKVMTLDDIRR